MMDFDKKKLNAYWLYLTGIPEAVEYGRRLGLDKEVEPERIPHSEDMCFLNPLVHEIRYRAINYYIEQSGCRNILDIGCGYSPRGIRFAEQGAGFRYIGLNRAEMANKLRSAAGQRKPERSEIRNEKDARHVSQHGRAVETAAGVNPEYLDLDVTDYPSLKAVADQMPGPLCVVADGFSSQLNALEMAAFRENIVRLLQEYENSVCLTTDPSQGFLLYDVIAAWRSAARVVETLEELLEMYSWASGGAVRTDEGKRPMVDDAQLYRQSGLQVNTCPLLPDGTVPFMARKLPPDRGEALRDVLFRPYVHLYRVV